MVCRGKVFTSSQAPHLNSDSFGKETDWSKKRTAKVKKTQESYFIPSGFSYFCAELRKEQLVYA